MSPPILFFDVFALPGILALRKKASEQMDLHSVGPLACEIIQNGNSMETNGRRNLRMRISVSNVEIP